MAIMVNLYIMSLFTYLTLHQLCSKLTYYYSIILWFNYLYLYRDINNFSGVGIRLLYSPFSKIMSIHYFSTNSFNLTDNKKLYTEVNNYLDNQTLDEVVQPQASTLFLLRQIKILEKTRKIEDVHMSNQIIPRVSCSYIQFSNVFIDTTINLQNAI